MGLLLVSVLISGAYPAFLLSAPQISNVLKGIFAKDIGGANLRKGLVVFQFTISIGLIVGTWLVSRQIAYVNQQDLGINVEQMMTISPPTLTRFDSIFFGKLDAFKAELAQVPGVEKVTTSSRVPGQNIGRIFQIEKAAEPGQYVTSNFINADHDYAATYGLAPVAGRFLKPSDHDMVFANIDKLVISEASVDLLGYADAAAAINERVNFWGKSWQIVGVVPNYHQQSLHHRMESLFMISTYGTMHPFSLRVNTQNIEQTIAQVQAVYQDFFPGNYFDYQFLNDRYQTLYEADLRFGNILSFFTLLTIFIACLDLFGLTSYTTFLRTKEIGVRKVLGASVVDLVALLSKNFMLLVIIALFFALPIAYYFMHQWLDNFAYRIEMSWWIFALAGVAAILIAFLTVSVQSVKAALGNPVTSLKNE
ncbi:MAG: FtsX-like permease family protein [Bacteroidota bacterium]